MGRRKIEIEPIRDDRNRLVTFIKRKQGLFKKAHELAVLCEVDIAVIILGHNKTFYEFSSVETDQLLDAYQNNDNLRHELTDPSTFGDFERKQTLVIRENETKPTGSGSDEQGEDYEGDEDINNSNEADEKEDYSNEEEESSQRYGFQSGTGSSFDPRVSKNRSQGESGIRVTRSTTKRSLGEQETGSQRFKRLRTSNTDDNNRNVSARSIDDTLQGSSDHVTYAGETGQVTNEPGRTLTDDFNQFRPSENIMSNSLQQQVQKQFQNLFMMNRSQRPPVVPTNYQQQQLHLQEQQQQPQGTHKDQILGENDTQISENQPLSTHKRQQQHHHQQQQQQQQQMDVISPSQPTSTHDFKLQRTDQLIGRGEPQGPERNESHDYDINQSLRQEASDSNDVRASRFPADKPKLTVDIPSNSYVNSATIHDESTSASGSGQRQYQIQFNSINSNDNLLRNVSPVSSNPLSALERDQSKILWRMPNGLTPGLPGVLSFSPTTSQFPGTTPINTMIPNGPSNQIHEATMEGSTHRGGVSKSSDPEKKPALQPLQTINAATGLPDQPPTMGPPTGSMPSKYIQDLMVTSPNNSAIPMFPDWSLGPNINRGTAQPQDSAYDPTQGNTGLTPFLQTGQTPTTRFFSFNSDLSEERSTKH
ncbi:Transcription factor RLM1 [Nakaseomyces bracarensis]|uniref:Transcription factor RLM1 n=1 Tax=Nakaseomyces bracarensis TaxID=273131 RepID=A0ABR4NXZ3_9SACH